jgi:hypothetical protein
MLIHEYYLMKMVDERMRFIALARSTAFFSRKDNGKSQMLSELQSAEVIVAKRLSSNIRKFG